MRYFRPYFQNRALFGHTRCHSTLSYRYLIFVLTCAKRNGDFSNGKKGLDVRLRRTGPYANVLLGLELLSPVAPPLETRWNLYDPISAGTIYHGQFEAEAGRPVRACIRARA